MDELPYLGHLITPEGLKPDPAKVKVVQEMRAPKDIMEVRQFLGLCSYY